MEFRRPLGLAVITLTSVVLLGGCTDGASTPSSAVDVEGLEAAAVTTTPPASTPSDAEAPATSDPAVTPTTSPEPVVPRPVVEIETFDVPEGSRPHDVAPAPDGTVWYTAQRRGALGVLDPADGSVVEIPLGEGSAPHGVIVGPDGAAWVTDGGLNAIVRVDTQSQTVERFPLEAPYANLNTAAFDAAGTLWFTGQEGVYGSVEPDTGTVEVFDAPGGRGPYGIEATPDGRIFYVSLAGSHLAEIDTSTGRSSPIDALTPAQGARRVWSDSHGVLWISEWEAGQLARYDPASGDWVEYQVPREDPRIYAVYVDETDQVWISDFGDGGAMLRFDPRSESFESYELASPGGDVRQILGRDGEVWAPLSGTDELMVFRY